MPLSRAEISKRYREKQKANNLEAFREKERIRGNLNYKKLKNEEIKVKEEENKEEEIKVKEEEIKEKMPTYFTNLNIANVDDSGFIIYKPIKKRINSLNKSILQPQTIQLYFNCFKKVYKNFTKMDMDDTFQNELLNLLNNKSYDIKYIKDKLNFLNKDLNIFIKSLNKNELQYIYSILTRIKGFSSIIKKIYPFILEKQIHYQQSRDNKEMDEIDKIKYYKISFNKSDIINIIETHTNMTPRELLLFGLFTLFPVRRPIDYQRMIIINDETIIKNEQKKKISDRNNYYYNGMFYFYRTKNKDIQKFTVPDYLNTLILNYIKTNDNLELKYLLLDNNNKQYNISTLIIHIMKVFNKIYDISFSAVELRHYYSTYINHLVKIKKLTIDEHKEICYMMNHSYEENKKYAYLL